MTQSTDKGHKLSNFASLTTSKDTKQKNMKQTIDIHTYKWFDKINGNTYFAQEIVLNYGTEQEQSFKNKFKYGYSSFDYFALEFLRKQGISIPQNRDELKEMFIIRNHEQAVKKAFFKANGLN